MSTGIIFITGATGMMGSHLVDYLLASQELGIDTPEKIVCLVRTPKKATRLQNQGVVIVQGTLQDREILQKIYETHPIRYVFHLAAQVYVNATYEEMYGPNVEGVKNMLDAFAASSAECFTHTSSIAVYSDFKTTETRIVIDETQSTCKFKGKHIEPYPQTKCLAEKLFEDCRSKCPTKKFVITRLGPIIGERDRQMLPTLLTLFKVRFPKLINGGNDSIALTAPQDVARAQVFLVKHIDKVNGQIFNVSSENITYRELFGYIAEIYQKPPPTHSIPRWLFLMGVPFLKILRHFYPNNRTLQMALSKTSLEYMGKSIIYSSEKLLALGFEFKKTVKEAIKEGIYDLDPDLQHMESLALKPTPLELKEKRWAFRRQSKSKSTKTNE